MNNKISFHFLIQIIFSFLFDVCGVSVEKVSSNRLPQVCKKWKEIKARALKPTWQKAHI